YLFVGDFLVTKRSVDDRMAVYGDLAPDVPPHRKLVRKKGLRAGEWPVQVESTKSADFSPSEASISPELYYAVQKADGATPLSALLREAHLSEPSAARGRDERRRLSARRLP